VMEVGIGRGSEAYIYIYFFLIKTWTSLGHLHKLIDNSLIFILSLLHNINNSSNF
jgi:hypothetical protein